MNLAIQLSFRPTDAAPARLCNLDIVNMGLNLSLVSAAALLLLGSSASLQAQTNAAVANPPATNHTNAVAAAPAAAPAPASGAGKVDFSSFQSIADRNIFNGSRSGQRFASSRGGSLRRSARVESFGLVGTLISEKGAVAFFDGSAAEYKKALKSGGSLAGFRIREVLPDGVWLEEGTNVLAMRVGAALRSEEGGPWRRAADGLASVSSAKSGAAESSESATAGTATEKSAVAASAQPSAETNDVLKRLMEKRQKENQ
jgi:hypothetical protein